MKTLTIKIWWWTMPHRQQPCLFMDQLHSLTSFYYWKRCKPNHEKLCTHLLLNWKQQAKSPPCQALPATPRTHNHMVLPMTQLHCATFNFWDTKPIKIPSTLVFRPTSSGCFGESTNILPTPPHIHFYTYERPYRHNHAPKSWLYQPEKFEFQAVWLHMQSHGSSKFSILLI